MSNTAQAPSRSKTQKSVATTVNVMAIIDTDYIRQSQGPNTSKDNPVGIGHKGISLICPVADFVTYPNNDIANLTFKANVGDTVSFHAVSVSDNSEDAIIIYGVVPANNNNVNVFNIFQAEEETRTGAAIPDVSQQDGLPALHESVDFYSYDAKVKNKGSEFFKIYFALYKLDDARENQEIYGYFSWDPTIEVQ